MMAARRAVLRMVAGAAGAVLLPLDAAGAAGAASAERQALAALSRVFTDLDSIRALGAVCLDGTGRPAVRAVAANLGTTVTGLAALDRAALRHRLDRRIRADFAAGRAVVINRWVLSETEARLYALIAAAG